MDGKPDRWLSMRDLLKKHGIMVDTLSMGGLVTSTTWGARIGLWVMPNNRDPGDLETFLEGLVPMTSQDWLWAGEATKMAQTKGALYRKVHARKAHLHTWLAWGDPPGNPYGTAIEATQLNDASPAADAFIIWFKELFLDP